MVRLLLLALALPLCAAPAEKLDKDTLEMVEAFLKIPTEKLPPPHIGKFLAVDPAALPEKLRGKFEAKRLELRTMQHIAKKKVQGSIRMVEAKACAAPEETTATGAAVYKAAGYIEIEWSDVEYCMTRTKCTIEDLMCEFSLRILVETRKGKKFNRYFVHERDPLQAVIEEGRTVGRNRNTNFFGGMQPVCTR